MTSVAALNAKREPKTIEHCVAKDWNEKGFSGRTTEFFLAIRLHRLGNMLCI
jgi:hypothetical protein